FFPTENLPTASRCGKSSPPALVAPARSRQSVPHSACRSSSGWCSNRCGLLGACCKAQQSEVPGKWIGCEIMPDVKTVHFTRIKSPVGPLLLAATEKGLKFLWFDRGELPKQATDELWIESRSALRRYEDELLAYFRGELREFSFPLDLEGTTF